jgi:hypothetical protein
MAADGGYGTRGGEDSIFIIGAMKSGTTTLFDILARHPDIAPAEDKEPGWFAFPEVRDRGRDWYDGLFRDAPGRRYRLEASTDYSKAPFVTGVWDGMRAAVPGRIKLIYIMRHPLRRIESHARHVQVARKELGQRISPRPDHGLDAGISEVNLAAARYAEQLDAYPEAWAAGDLLCLTLEELRADPDATLARVYAFLELDPDAGPTELPRSNAAENRTRTHPLWRSLSRLGPVMTAGRALLPEAVRDGIKGRMRQKVRAEGRFRLTPEEETRLLDELRPDLRRLRDHYRVDVERHWGIDVT